MAWRFEPGEALRQAFRRVATEEIAKVRAGLASGSDRAAAVHEARQGFKRLRALARLAKPALGSDFAAENGRWREAGRLLSGSRDRTVLLETFDKVVGDCHEELPAEAASRIRARVAGGAAIEGAGESEANTATVIALLDAGEESAQKLGWPDSADDLSAGLRKSQARLRKAWTKARRDASPEAFHRWRKRVKDQSAQLRLFRRVMPEEFRTLRNDEKQTAEYLGEEHDLWMLSERLCCEPVPPGAEAARDRLLRAIDERREALRKDAFRQGGGFSAKGAKAFARALGEAWEKASGRAERKPRRRKSRRAPAADAVPTSRAR